MSTTYWKWFEQIGIYAHYDDNRLTGYHIEPLEPDYHGCGLGNVAGNFILTFPSGDVSETYDTLEEAKQAAEKLYQIGSRPTFRRQTNRNRRRA